MNAFGWFPNLSMLECLYFMNILHSFSVIREYNFNSYVCQIYCYNVLFYIAIATSKKHSSTVTWDYSGNSRDGEQDVCVIAAT